MGAQIKKKARSFSLTDDEMNTLRARMKIHGFKKQSDYVLALIEADASQGMAVTLDGENQKVLRANLDQQTEEDIRMGEQEALERNQQKPDPIPPLPTPAQSSRARKRT